MSVDHDIIDGAPAARFAERFKRLIADVYGLDEIEESGSYERDIAVSVA